MSDLWQGLAAAFWLVVTLDGDLVAISLRSLHVSLTALAIACLIAMPFGTWLAVQRFRHRRTVIASITHQAMRDLWADYHDLLISLNTSKRQRIKTLIWDGRRTLLTAGLAGFGRAIGEVGAIMIVGGNIDNATRVLTTAIALETGRGDFALALGLGFVLIALALLVNLAIHRISRTESGVRW
jgi:tungstate transport system permease protein